MPLISPASKSRMRIAQIVESQRGVTPATGVFKTLPHLDNTSLNQVQTFERSAMVKRNRQGGAQIGGSVQVGGTIAVPVQNDPTVKELLESAFSNPFTQAVASGAAGNPSGFAFVTSGSKASGLITLASNPTNGHTVTVNGVAITFVTSGATGNQVNIAGTSALTATALYNFLSASTDALLSPATYTNAVASQVAVVYDTTGTAGNSFTLVSGQASVTVSGATLTGGVNGSDSITRTTGSFLVDGWHAGDQIVVANATTAGNNVTLASKGTVASVTALTLTLATTVDLSASESFGATTTATSQSFFLKSGTVRKFFTHEVTYSDLVPVVYEYFRGTEVNTANISVPTSGEAKMECSVVGLIGKISETEFDRSNNFSGTTSAGTNTRTDPLGNTSMAGSVTGSGLTRDGLASVDTESFSVALNNGRAAKYAVGSKFASHVEEGDFDAEITMALYFADKSQVDAYLEGTRTNIELTMADQVKGDKIILGFPSVVFTKNDKGLSGMTVVENISGYAEESSIYSAKAICWVQPAPVAA